jgi:hypothetical protein
VIDKEQFMADVIDFLERMGQDAALRHAPEAVLEQAMRDAQMSPQARAALMSGNRAEIQLVAGAQSNVCCMINVPSPEGDEDGEATGAKSVLGVDNNVCCMVYAPTPEKEDGTGVDDEVCCLIYAPEPEVEDAGATRRQKAVHGVDNNVCCLIYAPEGEEQKSEEGERQKAA